MPDTVAQGYDTSGMHPEDTIADEGLVRRLLHAQFPAWADLALERVEHSGTDHTIYRLGGDLSMRLPRIDWSAPQPARDHQWLPLLAPHLPVAISTPVALGQPDDGYRYEWSVHRWLPGTNPERSSPSVARDLAAFTTALQSVDTAGGWLSFRGGPLRPRDEQVRVNLLALGDLVDEAAVLAAWERALAAPEWDGPPVWVHGDLTEGNVLVDGDRLVGVIDFGPLGIGDPAIDLQPAWALLDGTDRETFRRASGCDDATWQRGRGWALSVALSAWPYYRRTNPGIVARSRKMIDAVLSA